MRGHTALRFLLSVTLLAYVAYVTYADFATCMSRCWNAGYACNANCSYTDLEPPDQAECAIMCVNGLNDCSQECQSVGLR